MEYNLSVKIKFWSDGLTVTITGRIHYVDPIALQLRIEVESGEFERIKKSACHLSNVAIFD
jgi:hypothetical protein